MPDAALLAVIGAECSGKTVLGRLLSESLPGLLVPEALREFVDTSGRPPAREEQAAIMGVQIAAENAAVAQAADRRVPWVVSDAGALMTAVYSVAYFGDESLLGTALDRQKSYAMTVWCGIEFPWQSDAGQRDGPERRVQVHGLIGEVLQSHGIEAVTVGGSPDERVRLVLAALPSHPDWADRVDSSRNRHAGKM